MEQETPIPEAAPETAPKDEAKVSQKHWPWIVGGLVVGCVILWNQHLADVKLIQAGDKDRINDIKELSFAWQQVALERRDLKISTALLVKYTNDTSIMRRIDSARRADQSRDAE